MGGLAAVELSTSLWELGHHHGLAMLALSRGAHAVTDLTQSGADAVETVVEVVSEVGAEAAAAVRTHSTRLSRLFTPKRIRNLSIAASNPTNPTGQNIVLIQRRLAEPG